MTERMPLIAVGSRDSLRVSVDARVVHEVMAQSPKIVHYWMRGFLESALIDHRVRWLKEKGTKFGRRSQNGDQNTVKVHKVNEGPTAPRDQDVVYSVYPAKRRASSVEQAVRGLREMRAEAFAGSTVLRVHEFGEDIEAAPGKVMAVPVKTRPDTPERWKKKYPNKRLEFRPNPKRRGEGFLFEVTRRRRRGRPRKGERKPKLRETLRLRFILTKFVEMDPTLNFYGTWDRLGSKRSSLWRGAVERMHRQLQKGDPRDF